MKINGKEVLLYIVERLVQVVPKERIVIATSQEESDEPIANFADHQGLHCFRGSLYNVAERFYKAAKLVDLPYAARINGDNIFLDADVLQTLINKATTGHYTFLSNVKNRTYPKGMSVEIVDVAHYKECLPAINQDEYYKEHVMPYLYQNDDPDKHYYLMNTTYPHLAGMQLALDTREDFERTKLIMENMESPHYAYSLADIYNLIQSINNDQSV